MSFKYVYLFVHYKRLLENCKLNVALVSIPVSTGYSEVRIDCHVTVFSNIHLKCNGIAVYDIFLYIKDGFTIKEFKCSRIIANNCVSEDIIYIITLCNDISCSDIDNLRIIANYKRRHIVLFGNSVFFSIKCNILTVCKLKTIIADVTVCIFTVFVIHILEFKVRIDYSTNLKIGNIYLHSERINTEFNYALIFNVIIKEDNIICCITNAFAGEYVIYSTVNDLNARMKNRKALKGLDLILCSIGYRRIRDKCYLNSILAEAKGTVTIITTDNLNGIKTLIKRNLRATADGCNNGNINFIKLLSIFRLEGGRNLNSFNYIIIGNFTA